MATEVVTINKDWTPLPQLIAQSLGVYPHNPLSQIYLFFAREGETEPTDIATQPGVPISAINFSTFAIDQKVWARVAGTETTTKATVVL